MPFQYLSSPQLPLPSAAAAVSVTSNATAWANSAWVELHSGLPSDGVLLAISAFTTNTNTRSFEIDIGVGGAGSEVVISTVKGRHAPVLSNLGEDALFNLPIGIDALPNGGRVACRIRENGAAAITWRISATYVAKPYVGSLLTTTNPVKVSNPLAAVTAITSSATAWVNGAWATVIASPAADAVMIGAILGDGAEYEIDYGVGGAGSEVVVATLRGMNSNSEPNRLSFVMLPVPLDVITSGVRVAARARFGQTAGAGRAMRAGLMYIEKPL